MSETDCPFCKPDESRVLFEDEIGLALRDAYPVAVGHTLIVPRRHVASLFELTPPEQAALWVLVARARTRLLEMLAPDGFSIGLNDGVAAGQTIPHAHIHLIPRRRGDVPDPRGGVRWVLADRARYW
jgi:diadenosine tetraphosphate (Ap4A) HIT family hydrolase